MRGPDGAVILLDQEIVRYQSPVLLRKTIRGAVRAFSEPGRRHAHAVASFNADSERVVNLRAWLVSANGRKVEKISQDDFTDTVAELDGRLWNARRIVSYRAPARLEVGGVLAWEMEFESQSGIVENSFSFRGNLPLAHAWFEVIPGTGESLEWFATSKAIPAPVPGSTAEALRWHWPHLIPSREHAPPGFIPDPLIVAVRCAFRQHPELRVPDWETLARKFDEEVAPQIAVTAEIRKCAEALTAGKSGRWERIRALTEFVQREISYLSVTLDKDYLAGYRPHRAAEVLASRNGDCKDKVTLLCTLLRAIGEDGRMMFICAGDPRAVPAQWPSTRFNHAIIALPGDEAAPADWPAVQTASQGRMILFDPTDPVTPLGFLPRGDQGGHGLLIGGKELVLLPLERPSRLTTERHIVARIDQAGMGHITASESYRGLAAIAEYKGNNHASHEQFGRALENRVHRALPLAREIRWTDTWDRPAANLGIEYSFATAQFARKVGVDRLMANPAVFSQQNLWPEWKTSETGVVWTEPDQQICEVRFTVSDDWEVEELPDEWESTIPGEQCRLTYRKEGRDAVVRYEYLRQAQFLNQTEYESTRQFLRKNLEALRRPMLWRRTASTKKAG